MAFFFRCARQGAHMKSGVVKNAKSRMDPAITELARKNIVAAPARAGFGRPSEPALFTFFVAGSVHASGALRHFLEWKVLVQFNDALLGLPVCRRKTCCHQGQHSCIKRSVIRRAGK